MYGAKPSEGHELRISGLLVVFVGSEPRKWGIGVRGRGRGVRCVGERRGGKLLIAETRLMTLRDHETFELSVPPFLRTRARVFPEPGVQHKKLVSVDEQLVRWRVWRSREVGR